jgi:hypothetical protein
MPLSSNRQQTLLTVPAQLQPGLAQRGSGNPTTTNNPAASMALDTLTRFLRARISVFIRTIIDELTLRRVVLRELSDLR